MHPRDEGFTWFSGDGTKASHIDNVSAWDCPPTCPPARLTPVFFSDHAMLSCTLTLSSSVTVGSGLWKVNCSLLEDMEIVRQYRKQYSQWQTLIGVYHSCAHWWEWVKTRQKLFFRQAGSKKKAKEKMCMLGLQKRLHWSSHRSSLLNALPFKRHAHGLTPLDWFTQWTFNTTKSTFFSHILCILKQSYVLFLSENNFYCL